MHKEAEEITTCIWFVFSWIMALLKVPLLPIKGEILQENQRENSHDPVQATEARQTQAINYGKPRMVFFG